MEKKLLVKRSFQKSSCSQAALQQLESNKDEISDDNDVGVSESELMGCLSDSEDCNQVQATNTTLINNIVALCEVKKQAGGQQLKELVTNNTQQPLNIHKPQQNSKTYVTSFPQKSQRGILTIGQSSTIQFLQITLTLPDGTKSKVLSSKAAFPVFQKEANFNVLSSVGKDIELTELNPAKESTTFWITHKTKIIVHSDNVKSSYTLGAGHKIKEEEKLTHPIKIQQFEQIKSLKVPHLFELVDIGDTSFNVFELKFHYDIYVYSNETSLLPKEKWTLGTLCFSKEDNGNTLKDQKGDSLTVTSNPEYLKLFGRLILRQTFFSNKSDIYQVGSIQFYIRANFKAYLQQEKVKFTMRLFITPIQLRFLPPVDPKELISIIYENRPFKVCVHHLNASEQNISYQNTQITIFDYFNKHRKLQIAIKPEEALLVHKRLNKEGIVEFMYFPVALCFKVLPLDKGLKDQSTRFGLAHLFLEKKYNSEIFDIQKSVFTLVNEDAFNFRPEAIKQAPIKANLIIHEKFSSHEDMIKQILEITGNVYYYTDEVSFMLIVQKLEKNSPAFVVLISKNQNSYEIMKAITHVRHIPTQFFQYDSLCKKDFMGAFSVRKHIKNQLRSKVSPQKLMVFEKKAFYNVTVISVDVYHQINFSIVGFMIINQQQNKLEHKFIAIEVYNNQEEIIQEQLQQLIQLLKSNNYIGGDLYVIRDAYNLTAFKKREYKLWETLFFALYRNIYIYFATKRHDIRNYTNKLNKNTNKRQVVHMSCVASYWNDNEFLFTTKENAVNLLYTFFNVKGEVLTKGQQVSMMGQLSRTHYQFNEFKQSVLHWLVDQNVYSLSFLNQYKNKENIDAQIKAYLNSVEKGAHIYDYSLT